MLSNSEGSTPNRKLTSHDRGPERTFIRFRALFPSLAVKPQIINAMAFLIWDIPCHPAFW